MNQSNKNTFNVDLNLNLLLKTGNKPFSKLASSENHNKRLLVEKSKNEQSNSFFSTFASNKTNPTRKKSQKLPDNNNRKIMKTKSANSSRMKSSKDYIEEEKKKDSYIYLVKLKKYYSMQNFKKHDNNINKSKYKNQVNHAKKIKSKINDINNKEITDTNNYFTINNLYINSKLTKTMTQNNYKKKIIKNFNNIIQRNISNSYFNKKIELNNEYSEIINTRKKFNEIYNHFYGIKNNNINTKNFKTNKNDISQYNTLNDYWNKRNQDSSKRINKINNELSKNGKRIIKSVPKIREKRKELAVNSNKKKIEKFKFNNIFNKLFHNKINYSPIINNNRFKGKPKINKISEKMIRTIDDLNLWKNKRQKKIKETDNKLFRKEIFKKNNINLTSEKINKDCKSFNINKNFEDRLIEFDENIKLKKNEIKENNLKELTGQKKNTNINYNHNNKIKGRYMRKEDSKNNDINYNSTINKKDNIFNFYYDYNINIFNKRTSLFDKSKGNIIQELNNKINKNDKKTNKLSKTMLLQNYMISKINQNKNNIKIKYNITDVDNYKDKNTIEELKIGLFNNNNNINNNCEKKEYSMNKNKILNNSERINNEKTSNIFQIKDKRMEDLKKIIDFSDKLYKNQNINNT